MMRSHSTRLLVAAAFALAVGCGPSNNGPDAGGTDGPQGVDAPTPGAPCSTTSQCPSGQYCAQSPTGNLCTFKCDMGAGNPCPSGWGCRVTTIDGVEVSVCLPPQFDVCTKCTDDSKCQNGACIVYGGESSCLPACGGGELTCPSGFTCGPDPAGTHPGLFCVPDTGSCTCTSGADDGMVRTCSSTNAFGTCLGLETCHPAQGGWTGCTAPQPAAEACDGTDNNCNGIIDEGFGGTACVNMNGFGSCPGISLCTGAGGLICQGQIPKAELCNGLDDNCDGNADETFTDLDAPCSAGVGACHRNGVMRCNAAGDATTCSAVAGAPSAELCNNLDDDCDGNTDEAFTDKGQPCSAGVGQCARQGSRVCSASGNSTTCSATPGTPTGESCNLLDDDCDGLVDEGFRNTTTGVYDQDTSCGSCNIDCTQIFNVPNASGQCFVAGTLAQCGMVCDGGTFDLDGDAANGCEFTLDPDAIYVSISDGASADDAGCGLGPVGTGPGNHPCRSIAQGISRANGLNRARILVANGIYDEAVAIPNGRSVLGGFAFDNWERNVASTDTNIVGRATAGVHDHAVLAANITLPTEFEGFVVLGPVNTKPSGNSYAIKVTGSSDQLTIKNNIVFAGNGGPGAAGSTGGNGATGGAGAGRNPNLGVSDATYDGHNAFGAGACNLSNNRQLSNGGTNSCSSAVNGGAGGGNQCPASPLSVCTGCGPSGCTSCSFTTATSINGFNGQGAGGGAGAARGADMISGPFAANLGGFLCYIPSGLTYGSDGFNGTNGGHGPGGAGCSAVVGSVVGGNWVGGSAGVGGGGGNGGGGGGGGAGGGAKCQSCQTGVDTLGGHGGGGGAGGCGGGGGGQATAGGGSFGIFIAGGASAPVVTGNKIFRGSGGSGGSGGSAGNGGTGGAGGVGGTNGVPVVFCTDVAGRGGNGGSGGFGGGGGGGCGGSSFGVFTSGIGVANYCQAAQSNTISGGGGGTGGSGGFSVVNSGGSGSTGALIDCTFQ